MKYKTYRPCDTYQETEDDACLVDGYDPQDAAEKRVANDEGSSCDYEDGVFPVMVQDIDGAWIRYAVETRTERGYYAHEE